MEPSFASPFSKGGSTGILIGYILSENQNPPAALWEGGKYEKYCVCDTVSFAGVTLLFMRFASPPIERVSRAVGPALRGSGGAGASRPCASNLFLRALCDSAVLL